MSPDGVVAHHESLSSFRPGFESRSGRNLWVGRREPEKGSRFLWRLFPYYDRAMSSFDAVFDMGAQGVVLARSGSIAKTHQMPTRSLTLSFARAYDRTPLLGALFASFP